MNVKVKTLLLSCIYLSLPLVANEQQNRLSFSHISIDQGLNWDKALDLYIDENGSIWINSGEGISRYDGNGICTFGVGPDTKKDFHTPGAKKITGNGKGTIYICGPTNLCALDLRTMTFRDILKEDVKTICCCNDALFFCQQNKVQKYEAATDSIISVFNFPQDYVITSLDKTPDGNLWIGTEFDGAFKLSTDGKLLSHTEISSRVTSVFTDSKNNIWIGTTKDGITRLLPDGSRKEYKFKGERTHSPASNFIRCFCEDNLGDLWIGTFTGLDCFKYDNDEFIHYSPDPLKSDGLTHNSIWCIKKDTQGTLWVGTFFGGVNYFNPEIDVFTKYQTSESEINCLKSPIIGQMVADSKDNLWIATEGGGLHYLNRSNGHISWYNKNTSQLRISENNIKTLILDEKRGKVWAGTHVGGLNCIDLKKHSVSVSSKTDIINSLVRYGDSLFIGTTGGLDVLDLGTSSTSKLPRISENGVLVSYISKLFTDSEGAIWIQTESDKSIKYWPRSGKIINCATGEFPELQDSRGNLWTYERKQNLKLHTKDSIIVLPVTDVTRVTESPLSGTIFILAKKGLFSYDYATGTFTEFRCLNETSISKLRPRSICVCSDGTVFIGGTKGLISINENRLSIQEKPYHLFFSKLFIGNEEIKPGDESGILNHSLPYCDNIKLKPSSNSFTIEFSSSNHLPFGQNDFLYRMSGVAEEWTSTRGLNAITFTNLKPKSYRLEIKPAFDGPEICKPISILIKLPPNWYGTTVSWIFYFLLAFSVVIFVISFILSRRRASDIENLNQAKLRFFTNISHEIRTPLTIITAEVESIIQQHNCSPSIYNKVLSIYKNCQSLKELVTELLEFRKQEQGEMKIKVEPHDIVHFTNEFYLLYYEYAESKGVALKYKKDIDRLEVWYDPKQLQKVFNNILSNALKFTDSGGSIEIHVFSEGSNCIIEISDTGHGIPESELENIFKRFYQVESSDNSTNESRTGTGIGLALAKGIIELHKGSISASSRLGKGSCFRISLPLGYSHFSKDQFAESKSSGELNAEDKASGYSFPKRTEIPANKAHRIVIAEDNDAVREILKKLFDPYYSTVSVKDGQAAWEEVKKNPPAIVISDVLMPKMTGTELCKRIKSDADTCDIPVVLLTARVAVEQAMDGLLTGADDYVTKPFNSKLLLSRCNNLVNSRIKLKEKYSDQPQTSTLMLATNVLDKGFIDKAKRIVESYIDNQDFNLNTLAHELGLSRSGLFKKIKTITGQTPNDFILSIRLKQAALLLRTRPDLNITEISEKTGFNSPRYFAKCFKDMYNMNPLAYRNADKRE